MVCNEIGAASWGSSPPPPPLPGTGGGFICGGQSVIPGIGGANVLPVPLGDPPPAGMYDPNLALGSPVSGGSQAFSRTDALPPAGSYPVELPPPVGPQKPGIDDPSHPPSYAPCTIVLLASPLQ